MYEIKEKLIRKCVFMTNNFIKLTNSNDLLRNDQRILSAT